MYPSTPFLRWAAFVPIFCALILSSGCKKGKDDPFISLRSRKAKVEGTWKIDKWEEDKQWEENGELITQRRFIADNNIDYSYIRPFETVKWNGPIDDASWFITKDGSWERVFEYAEIEIDSFPGGNNTLVNIKSVIRREESSGTWYFLSKANGYKNKERISMSIKKNVIVVTNRNESYSVSSSGSIGNRKINESSDESVAKYQEGELTEIWELTMLKHKEMKGTRETESTRVSNNQRESLIGKESVSFTLKQN